MPAGIAGGKRGDLHPQLKLHLSLYRATLHLLSLTKEEPTSFEQYSGSLGRFASSQASEVSIGGGEGAVKGGAGEGGEGGGEGDGGGGLGGGSGGGEGEGGSGLGSGSGGSGGGGGEGGGGKGEGSEGGEGGGGEGGEGDGGGGEGDGGDGDGDGGGGLGQRPQLAWQPLRVGSLLQFWILSSKVPACCWQKSTPSLSSHGSVALVVVTHAKKIATSLPQKGGRDRGV